MSINVLAKGIFLKSVIFRFFQNPSLYCTSTKIVKITSKPNQSKTTKEQLKVEVNRSYVN